MLLLSGNRADEATITAEREWQAPITNLQNRFLRRVARSSGLALDQCRFRVRLPQRRAIRGVVLVNHNLTIRARYRMRAYRAGDERYDSGWIDVYRRVKSWREMRWGDPNFWSGRPTEEDLAGFMRTLVRTLLETIDADEWFIEIDDQENPAGFVEIGRLFIAGGSQPAHNYSYGAELGQETATRVDRSRTGVKYFDRREPTRVMRLTLQDLPEQEVFERWLEVQRRMGLDGEVFIIPDPTDELNMTRRSFLGTLRTLPPSVQSNFRRGTIALEIEESL